MRYLRLLVLTLFISTSSESGTLTPGGGTRSSGAVTVLDALGSPFAGSATTSTIRMTSGGLFGLSTPTPVALTSFEMLLSEGAVAIAWSAAEDAGVAFFRLERAELNGDNPEAVFEAIGPDFHGAGPHRHRDDSVLGGRRYAYRLIARTRTGEVEILGPWRVDVPPAGAELTTRIFPANPNPFREQFTLAAALDRPGPVVWTLIDARGALVANGDLGEKPAGSFAVSIAPPGDLPQGIYFLRVEAGGHRDVQKLVKLP